MTDGQKIIEGAKEALEHAKQHAGCEHKDCEQIKEGVKRCKLCGCTIFETYADYCNH